MYFLRDSCNRGRFDDRRRDPESLDARRTENGKACRTCRALRTLGQRRKDAAFARAMHRRMAAVDPVAAGRPSWIIAPANAPVKPGEGVLNLGDMKVRVNPPEEWAQMYHEVWRIERAYFYDPNFHGTDTAADEHHFEPYVASIASRADLNYIFQEMLGAFSVGTSARHRRRHSRSQEGSRRTAGRRLRNQGQPLLLQERSTPAACSIRARRRRWRSRG